MNTEQQDNQAKSKRCKMIKNENFICIQGFMVNELKLKGSELLAYAVIFGFCQDGENHFTGSARYIAAWCGIDKRNALNVLKKLVDKGLIEKIERVEKNIKFCEYRTTPLVINHHRTDDKISLPPDDKLSPNNIDIDNIEDNKLKILDSKSSKLDLLSSKSDDKPDRSAVKQVPDTGDFLEGRRSSSRPTLKITKSTKPEDFGMTAVDFDSIKVGDFKRLVNYFEYNRRDKTGKVIAPYTKPTYKTRVEDLIRFTHGHWKMACDAINAAIDHNWQGFSDGNGLYWKKTLDEYRDEENFENSFKGAEHAMPEYLRQIKKL